MTKMMFFAKARFWLTILKILLLAFIAWMISLQLPELQYDLGPSRPVVVTAPEELTAERFGRATFVSVAGKPNFERAFIYKRYGLSYTYFNIDPYGPRLVVRTYEEVTDEWENVNRFLGKLRPFEDQPFSYRIRQIYRDKFATDIPDGALFLALDDVPRLSGWQVAAVIFASVLWVVVFYVMFLFRRRRPLAAVREEDEKPTSPSSPLP